MSSPDSDIEAVVADLMAIRAVVTIQRRALVGVLTDARLPESLRLDMVFVEGMAALGYRIGQQQIGDTTVYDLSVLVEGEPQHVEHGTWELMMRVIRKREGLYDAVLDGEYEQRVEANREGGPPIWPNPQEEQS